MSTWPRSGSRSSSSGPTRPASALPALVGGERLPAANSARWSASTTLTIAGVLVATVGPAPALWVDSASYLVSAVLLASIRRFFQRREDPAAEGPPVRARVREDIGEGLRFLWRHPLVRPLVNGITLRQQVIPDHLQG